MLNIIQNHTSDAATQKRLMVDLEQYVATWPELKADGVRKFMLLNCDTHSNLRGSDRHFTESDQPRSMALSNK